MLSIAVFQSLKALAVNVAVVVVSKTIRRSILAEAEYVQDDVMIPGLILSLRPANERRRYRVTPSLIGWVQTSIQPCVTNTLSALLALCKGDPPVPGGFPTQRDSNVKLWYFAATLNALLNKRSSCMWFIYTMTLTWHYLLNNVQSIVDPCYNAVIFVLSSLQHQLFTSLHHHTVIFVQFSLKHCHVCLIFAKTWSLLSDPHYNMTILVRSSLQHSHFSILVVTWSFRFLSKMLTKDTGHESQVWGCLWVWIRYGPLFIMRTDVLPQGLAKSRSREIRVETFLTALKFDRHLDSSAAEMPVKFQSDTIILVASRLHGILR